MVGVERELSEEVLKVHLTPKYFFTKVTLCTCSKSIAPFFMKFPSVLTFYRL